MNVSRHPSTMQLQMLTLSSCNITSVCASFSPLPNVTWNGFGLVRSWAEAESSSSSSDTVTPGAFPSTFVRSTTTVAFLELSSAVIVDSLNLTLDTAKHGITRKVLLDYRSKFTCYIYEFNLRHCKTWHNKRFYSFIDLNSFNLRHCKTWHKRKVLLDYRSKFMCYIYEFNLRHCKTWHNKRFYSITDLNSFNLRHCKTWHKKGFTRLQI